MPTNEKSQKKSQLAKFKEAARLTGTDNSEEAFDRALRRVAKPVKRNLEKTSKDK
jgi:hypothetical protein